MSGGTADPDDVSPAKIAAWRATALGGDGTPWLRADQALVLARSALARGEGVSMMEAVAPTFKEPPRDVSWEIIGADPTGENWEDHHDPRRAFALLQRKLQQARRDGAVLHYKLWLAAGET